MVDGLDNLGRLLGGGAEAKFAEWIAAQQSSNLPTTADRHGAIDAILRQVWG